MACSFGFTALYHMHDEEGDGREMEGKKMSDSTRLDGDEGDELQDGWKE